MKVVLASASERRIELLERLIHNFDVIVSEFDENTVKFSESIDEYVKKIALGKALNIKNKLSDDSVIIAADTIVVCDKKILGKPKDEKDAFEMLKMMQGRSHYVYSGIAVINKSNDITETESVKTKVTFSKMSDKEIHNYIKTKEPMDKAGAYGIQGIGGAFVEGIEGCYYNVVGLPLNRLKALLQKCKVIV